MNVLSIDPGPKERHVLSIAQTVGRLVLLERSVVNEGKRGSYSMWFCKCSCGKTKWIRHDVLSAGRTVSCGCFGAERRLASLIRHNEAGRITKTPEYRVWTAMWTRCRNPQTKSFPNYGGRGISVVDEWHSFTQFLADMGRRPSPKHTIERKDVNGPYGKENCVWATRKQQARNSRRNRLVLIDTEYLTIAELAERAGMNYFTLISRLNRGIDPLLAIRKAI